MSRSHTPNNPRTLKSRLAPDLENISDQQPLDEQEQAQEVAAQLALIRKRHDKTKQSNQKKKQYLQKLKKDLQKATQVVSIAQNDGKTIQNRFDALKHQLEITRKKHDQQLACKKSYLHVLDRMKAQQIALQMKSNKLQKSLKSAKKVLQSQTEKFRKVRQNKFQSRMILQGIKQEVNLDKKKQDQRLSVLKRNVKLRQEAALRREERQKRQAEIAQAAANDDKDSHEVKLRQSIFMHRFWYAVLHKKLQTEMENAVEVQQAFRKIKATTGLVDVRDIVERFLTREQTYSNLQKAVVEAEQKLEDLRTQNGKAREQLQGIYFDQGGNTRQMYNEIDSMEHRLALLHKEYLMEKEKLERSSRIYDQVLSWSDKIMKILEIQEEVQLVPAHKVTENNCPLPQMFEMIYEALEVLVKPLEENRESGRMAIEMYQRKKTEELVAEMSTEDALAKLVRVRTYKQSDSDDETFRAEIFERKKKHKQRLSLLNKKK